MISVGSNITLKDDVLTKTPIEYLYRSISSPRPELSAKLRQLRIVRDIDLNKYNELKKRLPYVVCAIFNPPYRRKENFAYTEYFVLDIDNISQKEFSLQSIKERIIKDSRVMLCFISPSEDGLKVFFRLKERCYDPNIFSIFYRTFTHSFSEQYNLQQVVDIRTSDVSRACFLSVDSQAFYRSDAERIDLTTFVDLDDSLELFKLSDELKKEAKATAKAGAKDHEPEPSPEVLKHIKSILNPKALEKVAKRTYVPNELTEIIPQLQRFVEENGVQVVEIKNINYGKQIKFKAAGKNGEVNLFYGNRGFSIVQSARTGTDPEFNKLMADLIKTFLFENNSN